MVPLKTNGDNEYVKYTDIQTYLDLVAEKRLSEFNEQVYIYFLFEL